MQMSYILLPSSDFKGAALGNIISYYIFRTASYILFLTPLAYLSLQKHLVIMNFTTQDICFHQQLTVKSNKYANEILPFLGFFNT